MNVCILCDDKSIQDYLKNQLTPQNRIILFGDFEHKINDIDVMIVVEPLESKIDEGKKGTYISIWRIWKQYLKREKKGIKLIVAGFEELKHSNYLQLLTIRKPGFNLNDFAQSAQLCDNNWEENETLMINGLCILQKLKIFFKGHDNQGIVDTISRLRGSLQNAEIQHVGNEQLLHDAKPFREIWTNILFPAKKDVKLLFSRWYNYQFLFKYLPFYDVLEKKEIHQIISGLNQLMSGQQKLSEKKLKRKEAFFKEFHAYNKIDTVINVFNSINKRYINIETAGRLLIVDDDASFHRQIAQGFPIYEFIKASTQKQALSILKTDKKIDMIILDLNLETGEQDGINLLKTITQKHKNIPVVMASTSNNTYHIDTALENGAKHYLLKTNYDIREWDKIFTFILGGKSFEKDEILIYNNIKPKDKYSILVIDDEEEGFKVIKYLGTNYKYEWARSLHAAKDILNERSFDLIILDLIFKNENGKEELLGLDFIKTIKKLVPETPIIVFTNDDNTITSNQAIQLGANYFLRKDQYDALIWDQTVKLVLK